MAIICQDMPRLFGLLSQEFGIHEIRIRININMRLFKIWKRLWLDIIDI